MLVLKLTSKKLKNDTCGAFGPYIASLSRKKKKFVSEALISSGCFWANEISSSRSFLESLPLQNNFPILSFHSRFVFVCAVIISSDTLEV